MDCPNGLTVDSEGNVYVANVGSDSVLKLSGRNGQLVCEFAGGGLDGPVGVLVREPSSLLVASWFTDSVVEYDLGTCAPVSSFVASGSGGLDGPAGLIRAANGNLLVASQITDQVLEFDLPGRPGWEYEE